MRRFAPAATGGETAQTSDSMADGEPWGEEVGRCQYRQPLRPHIEVCKNQCEDEPAKEDTRALERGERKYLAWVGTKVGIERNHQQLGSQHSRQGAINAQVHDLLTVDAALLREVRCHRKSDEK